MSLSAQFYQYHEAIYQWKADDSWVMNIIWLSESLYSITPLGDFGSWKEKPGHSQHLYSYTRDNWVWTSGLPLILGFAGSWGREVDSAFLF